MDGRVFRKSIFALLLIGAAIAPAWCVAEQPPLVWPPEPAKARIEHVREFSRAEDLGIARGFWDRVKDLLFGEPENRLVRPMAVAAGDGAVYVADPGAQGIHRFDIPGGRYDLIAGPDGRALPSPVGVAWCNGEVFATDSSLGQVFLIRPGAKTAEPMALADKLIQPTGIACDPVAGLIYVADTAAHRIKVFRRDGTLVSVIGRRGKGEGEFNFPTFLWRSPEGEIYVTDSLNFRIQVLDGQGHFVGMFGRLGAGSGEAVRQKGVATDSYGHVYVVDALFHAFQIFDESGRFLLGVGAQGAGRGEFWLPAGIFISGDNLIYVADSYNRRIQMFRYVGGEQ